MAAAALCCAMTVTVSLTSCSQSDNPIEPKPEKQVAMADVVTLDAWPHSFYKLDTKELLPISIAVNRIYEDEQGETQLYDLSTARLDWLPTVPWQHRNTRVSMMPHVISTSRGRLRESHSSHWSQPLYNMSGI